MRMEDGETSLTKRWRITKRENYVISHHDIKDDIPIIVINIMKYLNQT